MSKDTGFTRIATVAIATAMAVICVSFSAASVSAQGGSNPPWFPSLMAFEHYDSGRTKLLDEAQFNGSFWTQ